MTDEIMKPNNSVKVSIKKSSSKDGGIGWDIDVIADGFLSQKALDDIAEMALKTALKTRIALTDGLGR